MGMSDNILGIPLSYLGGIIMLASFYLMYLKSKKIKKHEKTIKPESTISN